MVIRKSYGYQYPEKEFRVRFAWQKIAVAMVLTVVAAACAGANPAVEPEAGTAAAPDTAISDTTTTQPPTTTTAGTTTATNPAREYDVVINGDTLGGIGAAVTIARRGHRVVLFSETGYYGGQATASGVGTFDEGGLADSGLFEELVAELDEIYGDVPYNGCYYSYGKVERNPLFPCPDPLSTKTVFESWLHESGVDVLDGVYAVGVLQEGRIVYGATASNGIDYLGYVVGASEFSDLYGKVDGLSYIIGDGECVQNMTAAIVRDWYPGGYPPDLAVPESAYDDLVAYHGEEVVGKWLARDSRRLGHDGYDFVNNRMDWSKLQEKQTPASADGYRAMGDLRPEIVGNPDAPVYTRSGTNRTNDSPLSVEAFDDTGLRLKEIELAFHRSYFYLWYLQHVLGDEYRSVSESLGYDEHPRPFNSPVIPDRIEKHMTLAPYIREGARLTETEYVMTWEDITDDVRGTNRFGEESVMLGAYKADQHGCGSDGSRKSNWGTYEVPLNIFLPTEVDGFYPGLVRAAGVDRVVSSSVRMHPTELNGGQVLGILLSLAIEQGINPRDVDPSDVRAGLEELGADVDCCDS